MKEVSKMSEFMYGTKVVAEKLSNIVLTVEVVRSDSIVCSYCDEDRPQTVELSPESLRLATAEDGPHAALFMSVRQRQALGK